MNTHVNPDETNRNSPVKATYRDIKADVLRRITAGEFAPGDLLPSELDLAQSYGAARATVSRALRELVDAGIVERKRKAGTRVRPTPVRQLRFKIDETGPSPCAGGGEGLGDGQRVVEALELAGPGDEHERTVVGKTELAHLYGPRNGHRILP